METIGLIGGITPQSTILYYQILNDLAQEHYGNLHSAKVVIASLDFGRIQQLQKEDNWSELNTIMANAAENLEKAGVSRIIITANTMHLCIDAVRNRVKIPVIHIAEATAEKIKSKRLSTVALLGTKYTMEKTFFSDILSNFEIKTIIPNAIDRDRIHSIIYNELAKGELNERSKLLFLDVIKKLKSKGAEGIILGCTEIPLLIQQQDIDIPVFDTTTIHAIKAFKDSV